MLRLNIDILRESRSRAPKCSQLKAFVNCSERRRGEGKRTVETDATVDRHSSRRMFHSRAAIGLGACVEAFGEQERTRGTDTRFETEVKRLRAILQLRGALHFSPAGGKALS